VAAPALRHDERATARALCDGVRPGYPRAVIATPGLVRAACGLVSTGLHVVVFVAFGHPARPCAAPQTDPPAPVAVDVLTEPAPDSPPPTGAVARVESRSFVPPPTHTHPYPVPPDHDAHPHDPSLVHVPLALASSLPVDTRVADAPAATPAPAAPVRFAMTVTTGPVAATAAPAEASPSGDPASGTDASPLPEEAVSSPARLSAHDDPKYPFEARVQQIEGDVTLSIVVAESGRVIEARVLEPAGFGFDEEALRAVRGWRFTPALRDGRRVAVRMRVPVSFRLR